MIRAARTVLDQSGTGGRANLSIVMTGDDAMRKLNWRHRQVNAPTDVLSFAAPALPDEISEEQAYLGDVVISHEFAATKAVTKKVCLEETLCLLVIHGTLHLHGYTHDTPTAREKMWAAQARALERMGIDRALVLQYETIERA